MQHVVILMQENRAFDHYFGSLQGVRGFRDSGALVMTNGASCFYQPQPWGSGYLLPFHITAQCVNDVEHYWEDSHGEWDQGRWDKWIAVEGPSTMAYYQRNDLSFYYSLADAYTICDSYHCSVLGPTYPNRLYLMTGTIDPAGTGGGPVTGNSVPLSGYSWTTYPERLQAAGVSWRVYQQSSDYFDLNALGWFAQYKQAAPGSPLYDRGRALVADLVGAFQSDVTNGTLPQVSWLIPPWSFSEHPYYAPQNGESLTKRLLDALASNPAIYSSTVFILTYDEAGGFFDHVPPPVPPPGTTNEFVNGTPIGLGVRIPALIVSPWSRGGNVCSTVFDHTSVIRFLEAWTGVMEPNISPWRRQLCGDLTAALDFTNPNTNYPVLPNVAPLSCSGGVTPAPPTVQSFPLQESGTRPSCLLPYQPAVSSLADCSKGKLYLTMTNAGTASAHFAIYANGSGSNGPWQYDVPAGSSVTDSFSAASAAGGTYDFSCYGPNGFQQRFAGNFITNCAPTDVTSSLDFTAGGIRLQIRNSTSSSITFTMTNAQQSSSLQSVTVPPGSTYTSAFFAVTNRTGAYDISVSASAGNTSSWRFTGQLIATIPLLHCGLAGTNLVLRYPGWAASYSLDFAPDPNTGPWTPTGLTPTVISNTSLITLPLTNSAIFFRLRSP